MKKRRFFLVLLTALFLLISVQAVLAQDKPNFAFVTNGVNDFWILSQRGFEQAAKDFNVNVDYRTPANGTAAEQTSIVEDLLAKEVDGIAITIIDPDTLTPILNEAAKKTILITFDSDAPKSDRICYIGTNNYSAGRTMGKLIKETIPNGGEIMLQVGKLDVLNAVERRQGIIDELKGLPVPEKYTVSPAGLVECGAWTILDTRIDNVDYGRAKQNAEDEGPMILSALKDAGLEGKILVCAFDELNDTLQGITDGYIVGTVVQDPYNFGYKSIEILNALKKGDKSGVPADGIIYIPERVISKDNVKPFWDDMNKKLGK